MNKISELITETNNFINSKPAKKTVNLPQKQSTEIKNILIPIPKVKNDNSKTKNLPKPTLPQVKTAVKDVKEFVNNAKNDKLSSSTPVRSSNGLVLSGRDMSNDKLMSGEEFKKKREEWLNKQFEEDQIQFAKTRKAETQIIKAGVYSSAQSFYNTIDMLIPDKIQPKAVTNFFENTQKSYDKGIEEGREAGKYLFGDSKVGNSITEVAIGASALLPDIVMAVASGGATAPASLEKIGIASIAKQYIKNPMFWKSFMSIAGDSFKEARGDGATEKQAVTMGILNGLLGSMVEVSGGIQKLPNEVLSEKAKKSMFEKVKDFVVDNMLEEGGEEVIQNFVEKLLELIIYDHNKEKFSMTNEKALLNPVRDLKSAGMGAVIGGIVGGGTSLIKSGVEKSSPPSTEINLPKNKSGNTTNIAPVTPSTEIKTSQIQKDTGFELNGGKTSLETGIELEKPVGNYPYDTQKVIKEYVNYSNKKIRDFVTRVINGKANSKEKIYLNPISENAVKDIKNVLGVDVSDYMVSMDRNAVEHIEKRHGLNGKSDNSMADISDIERLQWVLENYDNVEYGGHTTAYTTIGENGRPRLADTVLYSKKIDGTYYVVEAVPVTKSKTLRIVSAYISKNKKGVSQAPDVTSPEVTSETHTVNTPKSNISQTENDVNNNFTNGDTEYSESGINGDISSNLPHRVPGDNVKRYNDAVNNLINSAKSEGVSLQEIFSEIGKNGGVNAMDLTVEDVSTVSTAFKNAFGNNVSEEVQTNLDVLDKISGLNNFKQQAVNNIYNVEDESVVSYTDKEKQNWENNNDIIVYESNEQFETFVEKLLKNEDTHKKIYFGKVSDATAQMVYDKTGIDISGHNIALKGYEIRKILLNSHGNEKAEISRGQEPITIDDLKKIPSVITNPDDVRLSEKEYEGKPALLFEKTIDGKNYVVAYVSRKHHDIAIQTMYKKRSLATAENTNVLSSTSETTSSTASDSIVLQNNDIVNSSVRQEQNSAEIDYPNDISGLQNSKQDDIITEEWGEIGGIDKEKTMPVGQQFEDYNGTVNNILSVSDETAKDLADKRVAVEVLKHTPAVILDNVEDARDLKVIINYNKLYLAVRKSGVFKGHYHNLGVDIAKKLPEFLNVPDAIIQLANGRLNLFATVVTERGNNGIVSVELNSTKDINGKYDDYNVVVTMFSSDDNYVQNLISGDGVTVKYKREDLSQVNPQLYKWLAIINDKSSTDSIVLQNNDIVNSSVRQEQNSAEIDYPTKLNKVPGKPESSEIKPQNELEEFAGIGFDENGRIYVETPDIENLENNPDFINIIQNADKIGDVPGVRLTTERAFERAFGDLYPSFRKVFSDNFAMSKLRYHYIVNKFINELEEVVVKQYGIKKGSLDSELVQKYGEGIITLDEVKAQTDNWQNVLYAEEWFRNKYDILIDSINEVKRKIWPDIEKLEQKYVNDLNEVNEKLDLIEAGDLFALPKSKQNNVLYAKSLEKTINTMDGFFSKTISELDKQINALTSEMNGKNRKDTKAYYNMENRLHNLEQKRERLTKLNSLSRDKKISRLKNLLAEAENSDELGREYSSVYKKRLEARKEFLEKTLEDDEFWRGKRLPKHQNYFRHFEDMSKSLIGELVDRSNSHNLKSELPMPSGYSRSTHKRASHEQSRKGDITTYDAVGGFLDYIEPAVYSMTVDPNISVVRKLRNSIAKATNPSNGGSNNANKTITRLDLLGDELAGKTVSKADKMVQEYIGRKSFKTADKLVGKIKSSMIFMNIRTAIIQGDNIKNVTAAANEKKDLILALCDARKNFEETGEVKDALMFKTEEQKKSPFLTERYADYKSRFDEGILADTTKFANWMLTVGDEMVARYGWNVFYREAQNLGVENPVLYADSKIRKAIGGRGLGEKSLSQQSKIFNVAVPFSLEVSNSSQVREDIAREMLSNIKRSNGKGVAKNIRDFLTMYITTAIFHAIIEEIFGIDTGGFNPIGDIVGNVKEKFSAERDEDKNYLLSTVQDITCGLISDLPLGQLIVSYYPENGIEINGKNNLPRRELFGENDPTRYGTSNIITSAVKHPVTSLIPGGGQVRKTYEAGKILIQGGRYDKNNNLMYPVKQNAKNIIRGILFGKSAFDETNEYFDKDRNALTTDETKEYNYRTKNGEDGQDVYNDIINEKEERQKQTKENQKYKQEAEKDIVPVEDSVIYDADELYKEYRKIDKDAESIGFPTASKTFSFNGTKTELTPQQYATLQNMYNEAYGKALNSILYGDVSSGSVDYKYNIALKRKKTIQKEVKEEFYTKYINPDYARVKEIQNVFSDNDTQERLNRKQQSDKSRSNADKFNKRYKEYMKKKSELNSNSSLDLNTDFGRTKSSVSFQSGNLNYRNYKWTNVNGSGHKGIDVAMPMNTNVYSTISGTVKTIKSLKNSYGNYVVIVDDEGNYHYYAHLNGFNCKPGQKINRGDLIGRSGNSGNSTGPHLHYEVREDDNYDSQIDPVNYIGRK